MTQPIWKCITAADDFAVFTDNTGVYTPEMEVVVGDEDSGGHIELYRFELVKLALCCDRDTCPKTHVVSVRLKKRTDLPYEIHTYKEWFSDSIARVADHCGIRAVELRADLGSKDLQRRAIAYQSLGKYHGYAAFDHYPKRLSRRSLLGHKVRTWMVMT